MAVRVFALAVLISGLSAGEAVKTEDRFKILNVEGWTVYVNREVPEKYQAVEIREPERMKKWALLQQADVLHALALAYYDRHAVKADAELSTKIRAAYGQALNGGKYGSVLRFDGRRVSHPALKSEKEYFAALMAGYFLVSDHYPFIRCELKDHDPNGAALIAGLWQGNPRR